MTFDILFEDEHLIAINKPSGIMVHRTSITEDKVFIVQLLRNQIRQRIYPVYRLDRATTGVLVFGKTSKVASILSEDFRNKEVHKKYLAIIRGFVEETGEIDYALLDEKKRNRLEAQTNYQRLAETEVDFSVGKYPTSRYSFIEAFPLTGRQHQIRRHFAHIRHPIIGDRRHGDVKHNNYFRDVLGFDRMFLHASSIYFKHPITETAIEIQADLGENFLQTLSFLRLKLD